MRKPSVSRASRPAACSWPWPKERLGRTGWTRSVLTAPAIVGEALARPALRRRRAPGLADAFGGSGWLPLNLKEPPRRENALIVIDVRPLTESDRAWAVQVEADSWSQAVVARRGELVDPTELPGLIARLDGQRAGLASYAVRDKECELVTIRSLQEGRGVGRALLDAVRDAALRQVARGSG